MRRDGRWDGRGSKARRLLCATPVLSHCGDKTAKSTSLLGLVTHTSDLRLERWRQEDLELKVVLLNLNYIASSSLNS